MSKLVIKAESHISVELPERDYSTDEKQAVLDIQAILLHSGLDKYVEIGLPYPRK
jgi:hypothetical protein